jgi:hypothetical protein
MGIFAAPALRQNRVNRRAAVKGESGAVVVGGHRGGRVAARQLTVNDHVATKLSESLDLVRLLPTLQQTGTIARYQGKRGNFCRKSGLEKADIQSVMAEKTKGHGSVTLEVTPSGFRKRMFFNRFAIITEGNFRIIHFGYILPGNVLIDHFACATPQEGLERLRHENLEYLGRLGALALEAPEHWAPPPSVIPIEPVNHFGLARHSSEAEVTLHNFSIKALLDAAKVGNIKLVSEPVALLRSEVEVHKHFVKAMYQ